MRFAITGKHLDITPAIKEHAREKASKLPRYYNGINQVEVVIDGSEKGILEVEIIASGEHGNVFVGKEHGDDAYRCIDLATHKLERQLKRKKGKERDNKKHGS